jgi:hypothetical protein
MPNPPTFAMSLKRSSAWAGLAWIDLVWPRAPRPRTAYSKTTPTGNTNLASILATCAALLFLTTISQAQRSSASPAHAAPPRFHSSANSLASRTHANFRRSSAYGPGYASLPFPFFGDSFDPDDIYSTGYPVSSPPPPFLMQALQGLINPAANSMSAMGPLNNREPSSSEPLMIELQNGRYVHVKSKPIDGEAEPLKFASDSSPEKSRSSKEMKAAGTKAAVTKSAQPASAPQMIAAAPLPPAVLVFRDGHSEEVRDYTIADGILYARGDYYTDGYWSKKIDLTNLNVAETLQANNERSVKFILPSAPNEVITRP